jgi:hypothetical protein
MLREPRLIRRSAISWAIHGLCERPDFQHKLHVEISAVSNESPSYDELNSLPLLDAVTRETLRTYCVIPAVLRVAARDTMLPLSEPYVDKAGNKQASVLCANTICIVNFSQLIYNYAVQCSEEHNDLYSYSRNE